MTETLKDKIIKTLGNREFSKGIDETVLRDKLGLKPDEALVEPKLRSAPQVEKVLKEKYKGDKGKIKSMLAKLEMTAHEQLAWVFLDELNTLSQGFLIPL